MNIADVKKELSSDEKVLENVFKLETLYKKYKLMIWATVIGLGLFFVGGKVMKSIEASKLSAANDAFLILQDKADDAKALAILKEKNPALFELFTYTTASKSQDLKVLSSLTTSSNAVIADSSAYTVATLEKKPSNTVLYKEMAILEEAYLALKSGDAKKAKIKLDLIDEKSQLARTASLLKHATLKVK